MSCADDRLEIDSLHHSLKFAAEIHDDDVDVDVAAAVVAAGGRYLCHFEEEDAWSPLGKVTAVARKLPSPTASDSAPWPPRYSGNYPLTLHPVNMDLRAP